MRKVEVYIRKEIKELKNYLVFIEEEIRIHPSQELQEKKWQTEDLIELKTDELEELE